jgi:hypothetical protein
LKEALRKLEGNEHTQTYNETELQIPITRKELTKKSQKTEILEYLAWAQDIKNTLNVGKQFLAELTGVELDAFIDEVVKAAENLPTEGEAEVFE